MDLRVRIKQSEEDASHARAERDKLVHELGKARTAAAQLIEHRDHLAAQAHANEAQYQRVKTGASPPDNVR